MAISAFVVKVPAAEAIAGDLRRRCDAGVARPDAGQAAGELHARCTEVTLIENSSGRWQDMHVLPLPPAAS